MSVLPFLAVVVGGMVVSLLLVRRPVASVVVGIVALIAAALVLLAAAGTASFTLEGIGLVQTRYARILGGVALLVGLLVLLVTAVDRPDPSAAPALLAAVAGVTLAAASSDFGVALLLVAAASLAAAAIALESSGDAGRPALTREARSVVVGVLVGLAATALLGDGTPGSGAGGLPVEPALAGLTLVAAVTVLAHRLGAIPFHARVARLGDAAAPAHLPALLVIVPAAWGVVLLGWALPAIGGYADGLAIERGVAVAAGLVTLTLGSVAALLQDDVAHVAGYAIVAESGFALLALAILRIDAIAPVHVWLVVFIAGRSALLGWAIAFRAVFGTGRLRDTAGWVRRAPVLAGSLVLIAVAGIGWPGLAAWDARAAIIDGSTEGILGIVAYAASLGTALAIGRVIALGAGHPSATVTSAPREVPRAPVAGAPRDARAILRLNRAPLRAFGVLVLAALAMAVGAGGLGLRSAAAEGRPTASGASEEVAPPSSPAASASPPASAAPSNSAAPSASAAPSNSAAPSASAGPSAAPSGSAGPSSSVRPSGSDGPSPSAPASAPASPAGSPRASASARPSPSPSGSPRPTSAAPSSSSPTASPRP